VEIEGDEQRVTEDYQSYVVRLDLQLLIILLWDHRKKLMASILMPNRLSMVGRSKGNNQQRRNRPSVNSLNNS
jgi:hypothetical protein